MRSLLILVALAASALSLPAAASECLPSAAAVRAIHGQSAWSTIRHVNGQRCYMLGERHERKRSRLLADNRSAQPGVVSQVREVKEAELRSLFERPLPAGCPQARINEAFAGLGGAFR